MVTLTNEDGKISLAEDLNVELAILEFLMTTSKGEVNRVIIRGVRFNIIDSITFRIIAKVLYD